MPGSDGLAQPTDVTSRSPTVTRAWNVVVDFFPFFLRLRAYAPEAVVRALKTDDLPLSRRLTCAPATAAPACDTLPEMRRILFFALVTFFPIVTVPGETIARVSTVAAAFGTPLPTEYGVVNAFQTLAPAGTVKVLFVVNVASSSCAPFGERPGLPCGVSAGARHTTSLYGPSAASAPDVWSTCTVRLMFWPATESARFQTAMCGTGSQPGALVVGGTTTTSPDNGSGMFAS